MSALIRIASILAIGFLIGWQINGWRKDSQISSMQAAQSEANKKSIEEARAKEKFFQSQLNEAQHAAKQRETHLRDDANNARNESERLRINIAAIRTNLPSFSEDAIRRYADAASIVFDDCQRKYQELAEVTDRINNDKQTLIDAWSVTQHSSQHQKIIAY